MILMLITVGCASKEISDEITGNEESQTIMELKENEMKAEAEVQAVEEAKTEEVPLLKDLITSTELEKYFSGYDEAVMLIFDGTDTVVLNEQMADERFAPFSTFKIPNTLIALEEGIISKEESLMKWDGIERWREEWNQDQTLESAYKHSCVWYYQALARSVGADKMKEYLEKINYGNKDIGDNIERFWLGESLEISPREQLDFIYRLYHDDLPFSKESINYLKTIMKQDGYPIELYGKTGSSGKGDGWFVGYATLDERPYYVVTYITGEEASGLIARDETARILADML